MYTYFTFISIVHSLTKATHAFHIIQLYLQFEIVEFGFSPTELSKAFLFSNLGEELLSQSEFTVVQTQHLHSAKQMGHLRRRRWSRGGGTGTNPLNVSFCFQFQNIYVPVVCKNCYVFFLLIFKVKEQHYQRNVEFLADQLKVVDRQEAKNRIFFVSAKETLISRLHEDNKTPTPRKFHYELN